MNTQDDYPATKKIMVKNNDQKTTPVEERNIQSARLAVRVGIN